MRVLVHPQAPAAQVAEMARRMGATVRQEGDRLYLHRPAPRVRHRPRIEAPTSSTRRLAERLLAALRRGGPRRC